MRRRRLIAASDDEDEEADKQAAEASEVAADADEDKHGDIVPSGDYIQGVSVVNGGELWPPCYPHCNLH